MVFDQGCTTRRTNLTSPILTCSAYFGARVAYAARGAAFAGQVLYDSPDGIPGNDDTGTMGVGVGGLLDDGPLPGLPGSTIRLHRPFSTR